MCFDYDMGNNQSVDINAKMKGKEGLSVKYTGCGCKLREERIMG